MARAHFSVGIIGTIVILAVLFLGSLVQQHVIVGKWRGNFNEEMAKRLDLEEKVSQMEKERSAFLADIKDLKGQIDDARAATQDLEEELGRERAEKKSLETRIDQLQAPAAAAPAVK